MSSPAEIPSKPRRKSFLDAGGPNSINNFASSFRRAQTYLSLALADSNINDNISPCTSPPPDVLQTETLPNEVAPINHETEHRTNYGSVPQPSPKSKRGYDHIDRFSFPHSDEENLLTRAVSRVSFASEIMILGNSTTPQTVFNSVNTLMGIAMLSLSFGFRLTGWVLGTFILILCSWTTNKTAKILGAILKKHPELYTYGDIAYLYGGKRFQLMATLTFTLDLLGACIMLVLLFGDSFALLFPSINIVFFKFLIVAITFFMSLLPLTVLSLVSLTGILCTFGILVLIVFCGFVTAESPGSLLSPASTYMWPKTYLNVIMSFGIFMAPWGGHPVFPELYRDMRHPSRYGHSSNVSFASTFIMDYLVALSGFLMFGVDCKDSLTKNLMITDNYPHWVNPLLCIFLGVLPISKLAMMVRPVVAVYETFFQLNDESVIVYKNGQRVQPFTVTKILCRALFLFLLFSLSLVFTSFGAVIAFFGSAVCFTICVTLPLMFYLKFFADEISTTLRVLTYIGIFFGVVGAILGTFGSVAFDVA